MTDLCDRCGKPLGSFDKGTICDQCEQKLKEGNFKRWPNDQDK